MPREQKTRRIFLVSPTESGMTARGNRHPVLAAMLHSQGHQVVYLTTDFYHAETRRFSKQEIEKYASSTPYRCKVFSACSYSDNISVWRLVGNVRLAVVMFFWLLFSIRRTDILVIPSRAPEFVLMGAVLKLLRGVRLVMDVRDVWPEGLPLTNKVTHRLFRLYCNSLYRVSVGRCDSYLYTASGFLDWIKRFTPSERAVFVPLGYDSERWTDNASFPEHDGSVIRFAYVGDLSKSMDIRGFVEAIANRKSCSLTFIGGGERLEEIRQLAESLNADNVTFLGRLPKDQVVSAMQGLHISVIPMKNRFVMPNKLFDALASCRPLLVFGDNDASRFVVDLGIGWNLPFNRGRESAFLDSLTWDMVLGKSRSIQSIREDYAKERLYQKAVDTIIA